MRHDSNSAAPLQREELLYDCRALAVLISKVFDTDIPAELIGHIPMSRKPQPSMRHIDRRCVRCIVRAVKGYMVTVETAQDADQKCSKWTAASRACSTSPTCCRRERR